MPIKFVRTEEPNFLKDGWRVEMEVPNGTEIETIVDTFRNFLLGLSYAPDTVKENVPSYNDVWEADKGKKEEPKELEVGDRVRYYGAFNDNKEVSVGMVEEINGDLIQITLDYHCDEDGSMTEGPCTQWAHVKQLRRLKKKA